MRRKKSAFTFGALLGLVHALHPIIARAEASAARADESAREDDAGRRADPPADEPFQVPAPTEPSAAPDAPNPPHRDPMSLPVVLEHPEDKPVTLGNEKTRFGLVGGIGFPRPVAIGSFLQFDRFWSLGAEYSLLPTTKISDVNLDFWAATAGGRIYPFHGAFYVGLKGGYQHLSASGYLTSSGTTALAQGSIETILLNPEVGFLFTWESGVSLGFGAGVQIPLYANSTTTSNIPVSGDVLSAVGKLGTSSVPTVDLLRIGFVL